MNKIFGYTNQIYTRSGYSRLFDMYHTIKNEHPQILNETCNVDTYVENNKQFFNLVSQFVPARANLSTGLIFQNSILSRPKFNTLRNVLTTDQVKNSTLAGISFQTYISNPNDNISTAIIRLPQCSSNINRMDSQLDAYSFVQKIATIALTQQVEIIFNDGKINDMYKL